MSIYFPRMKDYFKPTKFLKLNSILNKLHFDKLDVTENELLILSKELQLSYTENEKYKIEIFSRHTTTNLGFSLGVYVENFYNDSFEDFKEIVIKNIKMRIAPPMVVLPINFLNNYMVIDNSDLSELLLLSVGLDIENDILILINPTNGEYLYVPFEDIKTDIFLKGYGVKWLMLNSPNMSRPKFRKKNDLLLLSLNSYAKEFLSKTTQVTPIYNYGKEALVMWIDSLKDIHENEYENLQKYFMNLGEMTPMLQGFGREYLADCISKIEELEIFIKDLKESSKLYQSTISYIINTSYKNINHEFIYKSINNAIDLEEVFWRKILNIRRLSND